MNQHHDSHQRKFKINADEWFESNRQIQLSKQDMNKLIMNFFIVEGQNPIFFQKIQGYKDAAISFMKETGTKIEEEDIVSMSNRLEIKRLILNGRIDEAIEILNNSKPDLLQNDLKLNFNLKLQKMIEIIKQKKFEQAISLAQNELVPLVEQDPSLIEQVEQAMTLLVFEDLKDSPFNDLVENQQRLKVSSITNNSLLRTHNNSQDAKILTLMRLLMWSQSQLEEFAEYPLLIDMVNAKFSCFQQEKKIKQEDTVD